jgi:hypothetical protein
MSELNELQTTANYYAFQKAIRTSWRSHILAGVVGIVLGLFYVQYLSSINIIVALLGVLLLISGIKARVAPTRGNLLLIGIILCIAGAWILIVPVIENILDLFAGTVMAHIGANRIFSYVFVASIFIGPAFFFGAKKPLSVYRHYFDNSPIKPVDEKLREMEKLTKSIFKVKAYLGGDKNADPSILVFQRTKPSDQYRIKLSSTSAIIVSKDKSEIIFVPPHEFEIIDEGKIHGYTIPHNIEIHIRGAEYAEGIMWPFYLKRYETWRKGLLTSQKRA